MIQPDCLAVATPAVLENIYALLGDTLAMMTVAPELPGSEEIIRTMMARGTVVSFGHSKATYEEALRGFDLGIAHVTHTFNAMPSLHHRDPSPLAAIFERPGVTCQVITDGVHIHPAVLRLTYKAIGPERFVTITDGIQALGLPDGRYVYNSMEYECRNGTPRYKDGTLIGTAVPLNDLLTRLMRFTGCPLSEAIRTVTENPARVLGLDKRKGRVSLGYDADLVILENDLSVNTTPSGQDRLPATHRNELGSNRFRDFFQNSDRAFNVVGRDAVVRDRADAFGTHAEHANTAIAQPFDQRIRGQTCPNYVEVDDVRVDIGRIDGQPLDSRNPLGKASGVVMVLPEPVDHLLQSHDACGGQDAGLPHAAAQDLANATRLGDERLGSADHRADRCGQPLGHADAQRIDGRSQLLHIHAQRNGRVEEPAPSRYA
jgi:hypothetical protein